MAAGRPSLYQPKFAEQAFKLCLLGATDKEMADFFEVEVSTINKWKLDYPEFSESIRAGKIDADANVSKSLYNRALGYDKDGKHYPPDTTAQMFWLKNRRGSNWREKSEISGPDGGPLSVISEIRRTIIDPRHTDAESIPPAPEAGEV